MSDTKYDDEYIINLLKKHPSTGKRKKMKYGEYKFRIPLKGDIVKATDPWGPVYVLVKKVVENTIMGFLLESFGDIANIIDTNLYRSNFRPASKECRRKFHIFEEPTLDVSIDINKLTGLEILKLELYDDDEDKRERPNIIWNVLSGETYDNYITGISVSSLKTEYAARREALKQWKKYMKSDYASHIRDDKDRYNDVKTRKTDSMGSIITYSIRASKLL